MRREERSWCRLPVIRISEACRAAAVAFLLAAGTEAALAADRTPVTMPVPGKPYYFQLAPIFVPLIRQDKVTEQVSVAVAIEIADGGKLASAEEKRPELDDAFLREIYGFVQQRGGVGGAQTAAALKARLRQRAERILGQQLVMDVMIEQFFEQPE